MILCTEMNLYTFFCTVLENAEKPYRLMHEYCRNALQRTHGCFGNGNGREVHEYVFLHEKHHTIFLRNR